MWGGNTSAKSIAGWGGTRPANSNPKGPRAEVSWRFVARDLQTGQFHERLRQPSFLKKRPAWTTSQNDTKTIPWFAAWQQKVGPGRFGARGGLDRAQAYDMLAQALHPERLEGLKLLILTHVHWFSLIFIDLFELHWFSLIFTDFLWFPCVFTNVYRFSPWFSLIFTDFHRFSLIHWRDSIVPADDIN